MTYEVEVDRSAEKKMRKVDATAARRIRDAILALADDPRPQGAKALTGPFVGHYRLRLSGPGGEYRIVWRVDDGARRVVVTDAGPREGTY